MVSEIIPDFSQNDKKKGVENCQNITLFHDSRQRKNTNPAAVLV